MTYEELLDYYETLDEGERDSFEAWNMPYDYDTEYDRDEE
jgi:hypothetical protein